MRIKLKVGDRVRLKEDLSELINRIPNEAEKTLVNYLQGEDMYCPVCRAEMIEDDPHVGLWFCKECDMLFLIHENPQV